MAKVNVEIKEEDFPSNSVIKRDEKEVKKIVSGGVKRRKEPGKMETIFAGIWNYVLNDILIPVGKSTIADIITNALEMSLYGEPVSRSRYRREGRGGGAHISYGSFSKDPVSIKREKVERSPIRSIRGRFEEVVLEEAYEAAAVLSRMEEIIEEYEIVTVGDLYAMVGVKPDWTDEKYGWDSLKTATVRSVREGYLLSLPKPIEVN